MTSKEGKTSLSQINLQDLFFHICGFLDVNSYYNLINTNNQEIVEIVEYYLLKNYQKTFFLSEENIGYQRNQHNYLLHALRNANSKDILKLYDSFIYGIGI
jgi:hypothetical protein